MEMHSTMSQSHTNTNTNTNTTMNSSATAPDEKIIAEAILKRAEIARITRQLKTKLLKAKNRTELSSSPSKQLALPTPPSSQAQLTRKRSHQQSLNAEVLVDPSNNFNTSTVNGNNNRRSPQKSNIQLGEYTEDYETDEYESPTKKANVAANDNSSHNNIPSSPLYPQTSLKVPSTPPRKTASLATAAAAAVGGGLDPSSSLSAMGDLVSDGSKSHSSQVHRSATTASILNGSAAMNDILSTPKSKVINNRSSINFKTPTSTTSHKIGYPNKTPSGSSNVLQDSNKKGKKYGTPGHALELLMFFANSPSPLAQPALQSRRVLPTTPKRLFSTSNSNNSIFNSTPPTSAGILAANALGSTPLSSSQHSRAMDIFGSSSTSVPSGSMHHLHPNGGGNHKFSSPVTPGKRGSSFVLNDFVTSVFTPSPRR